MSSQRGRKIGRRPADKEASRTGWGGAPQIVRLGTSQLQRGFANQGWRVRRGTMLGQFGGN